MFRQRLSSVFFCLYHTGIQANTQDSSFNFFPSTQRNRVLSVENSEALNLMFNHIRVHQVFRLNYCKQLSVKTDLSLNDLLCLSQVFISKILPLWIAYFCQSVRTAAVSTKYTRLYAICIPMEHISSYLSWDFTLFIHVSTAVFPCLFIKCNNDKNTSKN